MAQRTEGSTGIRVPVSPPSDFTEAVLTDVVLERHRQIHLWGHNETTPDGTGPGVRWALPLAKDVLSGEYHANAPAVQGAAVLEQVLRDAYDEHAKSGEPLTWAHFLIEELAEALKEEDAAKLYPELVQVAAVAVSWCEKIRQR